MTLLLGSGSVCVGPNVYAPVPVIVMTVDAGRLKDLSTKRLGAPFVEHLLAWAPALAELAAPDGDAGSIADAMLAGDGLSMTAALAHLSVALQRGTGADVSFAAAAGADMPGYGRVAFAYEDAGVAVNAAAVARHLIVARLPAAYREPDDPAPGADFGRSLRALSAMAERRRLSTTTRDILQAATARGIPWFRVDENADLVQLGQGRYRQMLSGSLTERVGRLAWRRACDRWALLGQLWAHGLPVPDHDLVTESAEAVGAARRIGFPVYVTPNVGTDVDGPPRPVVDAAGVPAAFAGATRSGRHALIEQAGPGRHYRLLVAGGDVVAAAARPAGGEDAPVDVTAAVHAGIRDLAVRAAAAAELDIAGVDLVAPDAAAAPTPGTAVVRHVVPGPTLDVHHDSGATALAAAAGIVEALFPSDEPCTVPVVAITGSCGKTTTSRMVAAILAQAGYTVGLANTEGLEVGGIRRISGECSGVEGARAVLGDRQVDAAVLETARGGILRRGLGFERCTVGAVINIGREHLWQDGVSSPQQLADVKSTVIRAAQDCAVLNADDPLCVAMARRTPARRVCFVSMDPANDVFAAHLAEGGPGAFLKPDGGRLAVTLIDDGAVIDVMDARDIPAVHGGAALHYAQNALFAAAIAHGLGVDPAAIRGGLLPYASTIDGAPGRANRYDGHGFEVVLDWGWDSFALQATTAMMRRFVPGGKLIVMISFAGDRDERQFAEAARVLADSYDHIVCSNWRNLRGRDREELPNLTRDLLLDRGVPPERVTVAPDQQDGVAAALGRARPGDGVLIVTDSFRAVWDQVVAFEPAWAKGSPPGSRRRGP